ncbi:MAG: hypothetical protein WDN50_21600 [Bradyrhizobium sp.]
MPPRHGEALYRPAGLLLCWAISARVARSIWPRRSLIALRSGGAAASRGVDFTALTSEASFSDCARVPAISLRSPAIVFSSASIRAAAAGSGAVTGGLADLDSISATRDISVSIAGRIGRWRGRLARPSQIPGRRNHHRSRDSAGHRRCGGRGRKPWAGWPGRRSRCGVGPFGFA